MAIEPYVHLAEGRAVFIAFAAGCRLGAGRGYTLKDSTTHKGAIPREGEAISSLSSAAQRAKAERPSLLPR